MILLHDPQSTIYVFYAYEAYKIDDADTGVLLYGFRAHYY